MWRAEVAFADRFVAEAPNLDVTRKIPDAWRGARESAEGSRLRRLQQP